MNEENNLPSRSGLRPVHKRVNINKTAIESKCALNRTDHQNFGLTFLSTRYFSELTHGMLLPKFSWRHAHMLSEELSEIVRILEMQ